jgi:hypothetical protein
MKHKEPPLHLWFAVLFIALAPYAIIAILSLRSGQ